MTLRWHLCDTHSGDLRVTLVMFGWHCMYHLGDMIFQWHVWHIPVTHNFLVTRDISVLPLDIRVIPVTLAWHWWHLFDTYDSWVTIVWHSGCHSSLSLHYAHRSVKTEDRKTCHIMSCPVDNSQCWSISCRCSDECWTGIFTMTSLGCAISMTRSLLQLAYCVVQFLEKDSTLTEPVSTLRTTLCYAPWVPH